MFSVFIRSITPLINTRTRCETDSDIRTKSFGQWAPFSRTWDSDWDGRHPTTPFPSSKRRPGVTKHIILIRHGQYDFETKQLTSLGRRQAEITAHRLHHMLTTPIHDFYGKVEVKFSFVAHSDVPRAKETARIIKAALTERLQADEGFLPAFIEDPVLAEGWPCIPEGYKGEIRPSKVLTESIRIEAGFRKYVHRHTDWKKKQRSSEELEKVRTVTDASSRTRDQLHMGKEAEVSAAAGTGEPVSGKSVEMEAAIAPATQPDKMLGTGLKKAATSAVTDGPAASSAELEGRHEYIVLICHQNVIRYFVARALQLPPEFWLRMKGDNCGITEILVYDDGKVSLSKFADVGHLPNDLHTFH